MELDESGRPRTVFAAGLLIVLIGAAMVLNGARSMVAEGSVYPAAAIAAAFGGLVVVVGTQVLRGRAWARVAGLVLISAIGLLTLAGIPGTENPPTLIAQGLVVAASAVAVWALLVSGSSFTTRGSDDRPRGSNVD